MEACPGSSASRYRVSVTPCGASLHVTDKGVREAVEQLVMTRGVAVPEQTTYLRTVPRSLCESSECSTFGARKSKSFRLHRITGDKGPKWLVF